MIYLEAAEEPVAEPVSEAEPAAEAKGAFVVKDVTTRHNASSESNTAFNPCSSMGGSPSQVSPFFHIACPLTGRPSPPKAHNLHPASPQPERMLSATVRNSNE